LLDDNEATLDTLRQIQGLGVKIALDDFGTGFSSLSYLRSFPFDRIKIDRSFVMDIGQRSDAAAIIRAILGLGRSLNIPVTAEGVETPEQLAHLQAEGCALAQGFLFSRPVATNALADLAIRAVGVLRVES
jgi:EAL domain-containing protein (putative c-di-GMP-specific phosphodiesterase class I)